MPSTPLPVKRGSCLCGGVRYEITGPLSSVTVCHCSQCRKTSGHVVAATQALAADIQLLEASTLTWYRSSDTAERAFCNRCGGNLFDGPKQNAINGILHCELNTGSPLIGQAY